MAATRASRNQRASRNEHTSRQSSAQAQPLILFQQYFKSIGPRTYAAQVKQAGNGNHFLVLTEGKRDAKTDTIRKTQLFVFSEDFPAFFRLLHETAQFIKSNPVPEEVRKRRMAYWAKENKRSSPKKQA